MDSFEEFDAIMKARKAALKRLLEFEQRPPTNADHIRFMTDEELAKTMSSWCMATEDCPHCPWYDNCPGSEHDFDWLDWLQQPYKEEDNGQMW